MKSVEKNVWNVQSDHCDSTVTRYGKSTAFSRRSNCTEGRVRQLQCKPVHVPLFHITRTISLVETDGRRIPVEDNPFHSPAPAALRFGNARTEQFQADLPSPEFFQHENILEEERRPGKERRICFEDDGVAHRRSIHAREPWIESFSPAESIALQSGARSTGWPFEFLEIRKSIDEGKKCRGVTTPRLANDYSFGRVAVVDD